MAFFSMSSGAWGTAPVKSEATLPPSTACSLTMGTVDARVVVSLDDAKRFTPSFTPSTQDSTDIGWIVSSTQNDLLGDRSADETDHVIYDDLNITYVTEPFNNDGTSLKFSVATDSKFYKEGVEINELDGMEYHLPLRDGDSILRAMLVTKDNLSCTIKFYDIRDNEFHSYFNSVKFVHPLHGVIDLVHGKVYIIDEYRIVDSLVVLGGSLVVLDLAAGTGERIDYVGTDTFFGLTAVSLSGDSVILTDTENHRVILLDRADNTVKFSAKFDFMRFPHAVTSNEDGEILVKAFDKDYMTPVTVHIGTDGTVVKKLYSKAVVGWNSVSGDINSGGLFVIESGRESENGMHMVSSDAIIDQRRLTLDKEISSVSVGSLYGDSVVTFEDDDVIVGFSPSGKENGVVSLPGASSGFVIPMHLKRCHCVVIPNDDTTSFAFVENDVNSASMRLIGCSTLDVTDVSAVYSMFYGSELVIGYGSKIRKYDAAMEEVVFEVSLGSAVVQIEEDEFTGVLLVLAADSKVYAVDSINGTVYDSYTVAGTFMRYSRRRSRLYTVSGAKVSRYSVYLTRTSSTSVTFLALLADDNTFDATVVDIAVQEGGDYLWVASENSVSLVTMAFTVVVRTELWDKISMISPMNYVTSVYMPNYFDSPYTMKNSPSSQKMAAVFWNDTRLLTYDYGAETYASVNLQNNDLFGVDFDGMTDEVYVSSRRPGNGQAFVVGVNSTTTDVFHFLAYPATGDLLIQDARNKAIEASYDVSDPQSEGRLGDFIASFYAVAVDGQTSMDSVSSSCIGPQEEPDFAHAVADVSYDDKIAPIDTWHLENTGLEGTKISIDCNFTFSDYERGSLRRVPVFTWDYSYDDVDDVFVAAYKNLLVRYSKTTGGYIPLGSETIGFKVTGLIAHSDLLAASGNGIVAVYGLLDFELVSSVNMVEDIGVIGMDDDYVWCSSPSRGLVYRMTPNDLNEFDTYQVSDAVSKMSQRRFESDIIAVGDNTIQSLTTAGVPTVFYNMESHYGHTADVYGDLVVVCARNYDRAPLSEEYATTKLYNQALTNRGRDNLVVINRTTGDLVYNREFNADVNVEGALFSADGKLYIVRRQVSSGLSKLLAISYIDLATEEESFESSVAALSTVVSIRYMQASDAVIIALRDGNLVYVDSTGSIDKVKPENALVELSSSSSSSGPTIPVTPSPPTYVEPEVITAISTTETFTFSSIYAINTGSSSSTTVSSNYHDDVQILVGSAPGSAELWDSDTVTTAEKAILYGGGNNLEPGQRYYASIRAKKNGRWGPYTTLEFVMSHFDDYPVSSSSSSSSSYSCFPLYAGSIVELSSISSTCVSIIFDEPETGAVVINGISFVVAVSGAAPIWNYGAYGEHTFTYLGESITGSASGTWFTVTWESGSIILRFNPTDSSSSCSSSSHLAYPDIFDGNDPTTLPADVKWRLDARVATLPVFVNFDAGSPAGSSSSSSHRAYPDVFDGGNPTEPSVDVLWHLDADTTGFVVNVTFDAND